MYPSKNSGLKTKIFKFELYCLYGLFNISLYQCMVCKKISPKISEIDLETIKTKQKHKNIIIFFKGTTGVKQY